MWAQNSRREGEFFALKMEGIGGGDDRFQIDGKYFYAPKLQLLR